MKITGNEPANPFFKWSEAGYGDTITIYSDDGAKQFISYQEGLTIRQHFAAMMLQGIVSNPDTIQAITDYTNETIYSVAVKYADGLIFELNKSES